MNGNQKKIIHVAGVWLYRAVMVALITYFIWDHQDVRSAIYKDAPVKFVTQERFEDHYKHQCERFDNLSNQLDRIEDHVTDIDR